MLQRQMHWLRRSLLWISSFVALTSIPGGMALTAGLESGRIPLVWLAHSPFESYVVPGLLLSLLVGGSASLAVAKLYVGDRLSGFFAAAAGTILFIYILAEVLMLDQNPPGPTWIEWFYMMLGISLVLFGLLHYHHTGHLHE